MADDISGCHEKTLLYTSISNNSSGYSSGYPDVDPTWLSRLMSKFKGEIQDFSSGDTSNKFTFRYVTLLFWTITEGSPPSQRRQKEKKRTKNNEDCRLCSIKRVRTSPFSLLFFSPLAIFFSPLVSVSPQSQNQSYLNSSPPFIQLFYLNSKYDYINLI